MPKQITLLTEEYNLSRSLAFKVHTLISVNQFECIVRTLAENMDDLKAFESQRVQT